MLRDMVAFLGRLWSGLSGWGVKTWLGAISLVGALAWWRHMRKRDELSTSKKPAADAIAIEGVKRTEDTLVISAKDMKDIQGKMDAEVAERVSRIRREADSARTAIHKRFGSKVLKK